MFKVPACALSDQQFADRDKRVLADGVLVVFEIFSKRLGDGGAVLSNDSPEFHAEIIDQLATFLV